MVSHDYFSLDIDAIWKTVNENINEVEEKINNYLNTIN